MRFLPYKVCIFLIRITSRVEQAMSVSPSVWTIKAIEYRNLLIILF